MASLKITLPVEVSARNPIAGDLFLEVDKRFRMTATLAEEVAQQLYIRYKMFQAEWFLDATQGTPWLQSILAVKAPLAIASQILRSVAAKCPGVAQVLGFQFKRRSGTRVGDVIFSVKLTDGTLLKSSDYGPFTVGA